MEEPKSKQPGRELPPSQAWRLKDYGIGPEPEFGSAEWEDWIETRAMVARLREAADRKKQGRSE